MSLTPQNNFQNFNTGQTDFQNTNTYQHPIQPEQFQQQGVYGQPVPFQQNQNEQQHQVLQIQHIQQQEPVNVVSVQPVETVHKMSEGTEKVYVIILFVLGFVGGICFYTVVQIAENSNYEFTKKMGHISKKLLKLAPCFILATSVIIVGTVVLIVYLTVGFGGSDTSDYDYY
ncbi:hypothetical protein QTN25_009952 [Entamoeba marina]